MFDLVVRNGTVVTASDVTRCDIGIHDGRIVTLGERLAAGREEIDATGLYVLPGGIDSHVHLAQPSGDGIVMADGFESGTRSALFGGNTTVLPFCLQQKGHPRPKSGAKAGHDHDCDPGEMDLFFARRMSFKRSEQGGSMLSGFGIRSGWPAGHSAGPVPDRSFQG